MLIAVDIGNTNIKFGVFENNDLIAKFSISATAERTSDEYVLTINAFLNTFNIVNSIDSSVISCVFPNRFNSVYNALSCISTKKPFVVTTGTKTGFKFKTDSYKEVGSDIISNVAACKNLYQTPAIIVDMGTVTTISYINNGFEYCGSIILPGVTKSHSALISSAAQLSDVSFKKPKSLLATNTIEAIQSGSFYSSLFAIDSFIENLINTFSLESVSLIATGGDSKLVIPYSKYKFILNDDLTLIGLNYIFNYNTNYTKL